MTAGARSLGLQLQAFGLRDAADLEPAIRRARDGGAQALLTIDTTFVLNQRARIGALAAREKLPVIGEFAIFGTDGVILAYGADIDDLLRRAASHVDRILKGARPGDLPVELPTKIDLIVNLKMARELGITVPRPLLLRAERVVE
jgi:putative ABC transport system substrate-binding protein